MEHLKSCVHFMIHINTVLIHISLIWICFILFYFYNAFCLWCLLKVQFNLQQHTIFHNINQHIRKIEHIFEKEKQNGNRRSRIQKNNATDLSWAQWIFVPIILWMFESRVQINKQFVRMFKCVDASESHSYRCIEQWPIKRKKNSMLYKATIWA